MVLFSKNYSFTGRQEYAIIDQPEQRSNKKEEDKHKSSLHTARSNVCNEYSKYVQKRFPFVIFIDSCRSHGK